MTYEEENAQNLVYFKMSMLQAEIKMHGMIAENKIRESQGHSMAHDEKSFIDLIEEHNIHHNQFPFAKH